MSNRHLQGIGFAEMCREVGERLEKEHEESRFRTDHAPHQYDPTTQYATVEWDDREQLFHATTVDELPFVGRLMARGRSRQHALNELRIVRAREMHKHMGIGWDDARHHCARYEFKELS